MLLITAMRAVGGRDRGVIMENLLIYSTFARAVYVNDILPTDGRLKGTIVLMNDPTAMSRRRT